MAEKGGGMRGAPVLTLIPWCSAIRSAKLRVVLPTYDAAEQPGAATLVFVCDERMQAVGDLILVREQTADGALVGENELEVELRVCLS